MPTADEAGAPSLPGDGKAREPSSLEEAIRAERARVAQILHDTVFQDLTGLYLMISAAARKCRQDAPEMEQKLNELAEKTRQAGTALGQIVRGLDAPTDP